MEDSKFINTAMIDNIRKELKSIKIGNTGYFYIMNSKGTLIVHPKSEGKNISKYKFIQEMIQKKSGVIQYTWEGQEKIVSYIYYPERDWIIAGGSYLKEFIGEAMKAIVLRFIIISIIVIIAALILLSWIFNSNIIKPVKQLEVLFSKIASGDLTHVIKNYKKDEIGIIIEHVDNMIAQMNAALCKVKESTTKVNESAHSLSTSSSEMELGAENQSQQVSQVEVAVHQMTATIQEISQNVEEVTTEINSIKDSASTGGQILEETVNSIHNLSDAVIKTADSIKDLGKSSEQIGEILRVISDIADQTNLLALNAAIEAARAGEHGRGFAVVADEVRKLAERTVNATSEIDNMIQSIQKEVSNSVNQMDQGVNLAEEGGMMVGNLKMSLEEIINGVMDIANKISSVAAAVEEQSATSQEISNNMADIAAIAQESSSIASENNSQAKELMLLAEELKQIVVNFKLNDCMKY
jgi:methyl-accepting chemotaxis protein